MHTSTTNDRGSDLLAGLAVSYELEAEDTALRVVVGDDKVAFPGMTDDRRTPRLAGRYRYVAHGTRD